MKKFNEKDFDIKSIIKKRVDLEAEIEHASDPQPELPKYVKPPKASNDEVGWWNFVKTMLRELNP